MLTFFRGWRRKIGVLTLLMACVSMVCWMRSRTQVDLLRASVVGVDFAVLSGGERFILLSVWNFQPIWYFDSDCENMVQVTLQCLDWERKPNIYYCAYGQDNWEAPALELEDHGTRLEMISYCSIVIPMTLLSAWLLLTKLPVAKPAALTEN